jgi:hypothetical protein
MRTPGCDPETCAPPAEVTMAPYELDHDAAKVHAESILETFGPPEKLPEHLRGLSNLARCYLAFLEGDDELT